MKYLTLLFVIMFLVTLACGGSNTGRAVTPTPRPSALEAAQPETPKVQVYHIGDIIQTKDHTIVLNSAQVQGTVLVANFTVENLGSKDMPVSSLLSFSAKDAEGTKLEQEIFDCSPSLDGNVLPGDKLKGDICWNGASGSTKIYYEPSLFGSGAIVWEVQ